MRGSRRFGPSSLADYSRFSKDNELVEFLERNYCEQYIEEDNVVSTWADPWCELTPGKIDQEAITWFSRGNCHALAVEINRQNNYPIVMVKTNQEKNDMNDTPMIHVLNKLPSGELIDINGVIPEKYVLQEWQRKYSDAFLEEVTEKELYDVICDKDYRDDPDSYYSQVELLLIKDFAKLTIKEYENDWKRL